jgi:CheY-like chemotaxis protein
VDDNVDAADSLALLLDLAGHRTATAHTGPAAVEAARAFTPEAVFLDVGLPGMNGYEVASALRTEPSLADVMLVAVTGWGTEADRRRALEAGFDYHLTKPVEAGRVFELLSRVPAVARV